MNTIATFLKKTDVFGTLPDQELERLSLLGQVTHHAKGEVIYNEGEEAASVWILQEGRAIIFKYHSDGRPLAIDAIGPREFISTLDRLGGTSATYPCTAVACADTVSLRIPDRFVKGMYARYPAMVSKVFELCARQLGRMRERVIAAQEPVQQRILRTLFQLKQTNGNVLPYTKREISELSATTVETAIRVLSDLQKKRWVSSERGRITLVDIPHLQSLLVAA